ncbi:MAG TPA: Glu/Leu/Phe/Val dehydrogenase [Chondromyces sp.]|nr:Glu/Leu/Phe/Val dehydrogenase [Chondromyces sp.]
MKPAYTSSNSFNDILKETQTAIHIALDKLGYTAEMFELLKEPLRTLTVKIPVKMDDGSIRFFTGFRAQHNDAIGPTKGGIRFHPNLTVEEVKAHSVLMGVRAGIIDVPYGGGSGGIICDPRQLSYAEIERLSRGYVRAISQIVGPNKDIPSPDTQANVQMMSWMMDEYSKLDEFHSPAFITGKPRSLGGTYGRETAVAKGVFYCIQKAAENINLKLEGAKVIVQGFGRVGGYVAKSLREAGASIIAVSDAHGALYDAQGLDIDYLLDRRDSFGSVTNLFESKLTDVQMLKLPCDILVTAALDNQINEDNAYDIQAKIVAEVARNAVTLDGTSILFNNNILLIPNILASSGELALSYFEWVQNRQGYYWTKNEIDERLQKVMTHAFQDVFQISKTRQVHMRMAAYMTGVRKIAEACRFRGWV